MGLDVIASTKPGEIAAGRFVLRPDARTVQRRTVRLTDVAEALNTAQVPVIAGLDGSETVIVAGMSRLVDGSRVTVAAAATRTEPAVRTAAP